MKEQNTYQAQALLKQNRGLKESEYERTRNHLGAGKHKGSFFLGWPSTQFCLGCTPGTVLFSVGLWETRLSVEFVLAHLSSVVLSANVKCGRKTQNFSCASTTRVLHKQPTTHRTAKTWQKCRKVKPQKKLYKLWLPGQKRKRRKLFCLGLFFHCRKQDAYEATCNPGREGTRQISQYKYTPIYTENENLTGEPQDSSVCDGALGLWRYAVLGILNLTVTWPRFVPLRRRCKNEDCTEELKRCKSSLRKKKC